MAGLLVSVRSAVEAQAACKGGATVVDIKEPRLGPLGRASEATWRAVRRAVPPEVPVSVALGELADLRPGSIPPEDLAGIAFRKAGPAGLGRDWPRRWDEARRADAAATRWVAVAYADWRQAGAPDPDAVIAAALAADDCPGVLVDTWDKSAGPLIDSTPTWRDRVAAIQGSGRFVALAGRLNLAEICRLRPLGPDLFAVRGAACRGGRRDAEVCADRVAGLVASIGSVR